MMSERINIRGVNFDNVDMNEAQEIVKGFLSGDKTCKVFTPNSEIVQACINDTNLFEIINSADLIIPDGIGVIYASKILKTPLKQKVAGVELAEKTIEYISKTGDGLYILGGGKKTEQRDCVAAVAAEKMSQKYPGLNVCGTRDGYFSKQDTQSIIDDINNSGAKVLFVCLGAPKQEKWIYENLPKFTSLKLAMGLGGSVDVFAGVAKRAPEIFVKLNLEWFYRLLKYPTRIGRMMSLPKFLFGTIAYSFKKK